VTNPGTYNLVNQHPATHASLDATADVGAGAYAGKGLDFAGALWKAGSTDVSTHAKNMVKDTAAITFDDLSLDKYSGTSGTYVIRFENEPSTTDQAIAHVDSAGIAISWNQVARVNYLAQHGYYLLTPESDQVYKAGLQIPFSLGMYDAYNNFVSDDSNRVSTVAVQASTGGSNHAVRYSSSEGTDQVRVLKMSLDDQKF
jgi:hypothetical protein